MSSTNGLFKPMSCQSQAMRWGIIYVLKKDSKVIIIRERIIKYILRRWKKDYKNEKKEKRKTNKQIKCRYFVLKVG